MAPAVGAERVRLYGTHKAGASHIAYGRKIEECSANYWVRSTAVAQRSVCKVWSVDSIVQPNVYPS
jgi:hypothetical protein